MKKNSILIGANGGADMAVLLLVFSTLVQPLTPIFSSKLVLLMILVGTWSIWKIGKTAWNAWSKLHHYHHILEYERLEIKKNSLQKRGELKLFYEEKGFKGPLLENVLDTLMMDENRLLRASLEAKSLYLENTEHPLEEGLSAGIGSFLSGILSCLFYWLLPESGLYVSTLFTLSISSLIISHYLKNDTISAIIWMLGIGMLPIGFAYFLVQQGFFK